MKKVLTIISIVSLFLTGCLKDATINTDNGLFTTGTTIEIPYSGMENFANASVLTAGTSVPIKLPVVVNIAAANGGALSKDLTVTLAVDDAARTSYNTQNPSSPQYQAMPDSCYSFPVTSGTIKAGQYLDTFYVTFYPTKIDPTKNYMAAITLKDAQGQRISGNFHTVYYHTIGNPLAGSYVWNFKRWNNATATGNPSTVFTDVTTFLPDDPTTIEVASGYFIGPRYVLTFTNNNGLLSNFAVTMNSSDVTALGSYGVSIATGPNILLADPIGRIFTFQYTVAVGSAGRYLIDSYHQ